jgi:hypothetical protein
MNAVELLHAEAGSTPSGTGSYTYYTNVRVVVADLAHDKSVGLWGRNRFSGVWQFYPFGYVASLPGGVELWSGHIVNEQIDAFDVRYLTSGQAYWDNNGGHDYLLDTTAAASTDGIGSAVIGRNVQVVSWGNSGAGQLVTGILVRDAAYAKQVGIVYTTDHWATAHTVYANFDEQFPPLDATYQLPAELWHVSVPLGPGQSGEFAAFTLMNGATFWDNNYWLNYAF